MENSMEEKSVTKQELKSGEAFDFSSNRLNPETPALTDNESNITLETLTELNKLETPALTDNESNITLETLTGSDKPEFPTGMLDVESVVPETAQDGERIEKSWIDKAIAALSETKGNPFEGQQRFSTVRVEYLRARFEDKKDYLRKGKAA